MLLLVGKSNHSPHDYLMWNFAGVSAIRYGDMKLINLPDKLPMLYNLSELEREKYKSGTIGIEGTGTFFTVNLSVFNPVTPSKEAVVGFVESNGYISIEAEHYSKKADQAHAAWNIINGLGRSGNSITVLPTNIDSNVSLDDIISKSPLLEYDIYTFTEGEVAIDFNCIPSYLINADYGFRIAMAVDYRTPIIISPSGRRNIMENIMENLMNITANLDMGNEGQHILKVWMVDTGVVIDKIIINTGGVRESYLGPPESLFNNAR